MENRQKFTLTILIVFIFMLGILGGLWADKNTRDHCMDDLQYCVDKYHEDCGQGTNILGINTTGLDIYIGGDTQWKENKSLI